MFFIISLFWCDACFLASEGEMNVMDWHWNDIIFQWKIKINLRTLLLTEIYRSIEPNQKYLSRIDWI